MVSSDRYIRTLDNLDRTSRGKAYESKSTRLGQGRTQVPGRGRSEVPGRGRSEVPSRGRVTPLTGAPYSRGGSLEDLRGVSRSVKTRTLAKAGPSRHNRALSSPEIKKASEGLAKGHLKFSSEDKNSPGLRWPARPKEPEANPKAQSTPITGRKGEDSKVSPELESTGGAGVRGVLVSAEKSAARSDSLWWEGEDFAKSFPLQATESDRDISEELNQLERRHDRSRVAPAYCPPAPAGTPPVKRSDIAEFLSTAAKEEFERLRGDPFSVVTKGDKSRNLSPEESRELSHLEIRTPPVLRDPCVEQSTRAGRTSKDQEDPKGRLTETPTEERPAAQLARERIQEYLELYSEDSDDTQGDPDYKGITNHRSYQGRRRGSLPRWSSIKKGVSKLLTQKRRSRSFSDLSRKLSVRVKQELEEGQKPVEKPGNSESADPRDSQKRPPTTRRLELQQKREDLVKKRYLAEYNSDLKFDWPIFDDLCTVVNMSALGPLSQDQVPIFEMCENDEVAGENKKGARLRKRRAGCRKQVYEYIESLSKSMAFQRAPDIYADIEALRSLIKRFLDSHEALIDEVGMEWFV